jgi:hypothetical protein
MAPSSHDHGQLKRTSPFRHSADNRASLPGALPTSTQFGQPATLPRPWPESALGPCRNGPARAAAVTNRYQRFRETVGHRPSRSRSRDDASGRFGLWSRRSEASALTAQSDGPDVVVAALPRFAIGGLGDGSVRTAAPRPRPGVSGQGRQCRCGAAPCRQARAGRSRPCRRGRCRCGRGAEPRPWRPAQACGSTWSPTPNRLGGRAESPSDE